MLDNMRKYIPFNNNTILDVGCGVGAMLKYLRPFGHVTGLDSSEEAVRICNLLYGEGSGVKLGNLTKEVPFEKKSFSVITLLDVIEHIDDDLEFLRTINDLLMEDGILICTVPAYPFLWGGQDILSYHKRRYWLKELREKIQASGFKIKKISYFNTLLAPFVFLIRLVVLPKYRMKPKSDVKIYPYGLNTLLKKIFFLEKYFLRFINFPFGISVICIAQKVVKK